MSCRVYLDANVFIYAFEGTEGQSAPVRGLLRFLDQRPGIAVTSELTLAEVLVQSNPVLRRAVFDTLLWRRIIALVPVSREVLIQSADLRKKVKRKLADAVHIITAVEARCDFMMSSDKDMKKIPGSMIWVRPDLVGVGTIESALA